MAIARADTVIIDGDVNQFVKKAESGNHRIHAFDGTCGSQMFATDLDRSMFNILIGCLNQHAQIKPRGIFSKAPHCLLQKVSKRINGWKKDCSPI